MDENEILARFGIGKKFAYGLFIQSILVIISAILALNALQWHFIDNLSPMGYVSFILVFLTCISLIIYSFYEYNKNTQYFFIISIILIIINNLLFVIFSGTKTHILCCFLIQALLYICFLYTFNKKYTSAKYIIILAVIFLVIGEILYCLDGGLAWYASIPDIVIAVSIVLTYFERVQRGKYPKLK